MNTLLHIITKFITKINLQINVVAARTKYLFSPHSWQLNGNTVIWMQLSDCWKRQQWILLNHLSRFSIVSEKEISTFSISSICLLRCLAWNIPDPRWDDKSEIMKASVVQYCYYKSQRSWQSYQATMHLCLVTCNISMSRKTHQPPPPTPANRRGKAQPGVTNEVRVLLLWPGSSQRDPQSVLFWHPHQ